MDFISWHYEIDTLPHIEQVDDPDRRILNLHVPIGVWSDLPHPFNIILEIWVNDNPSFRIGLDQTNPNGFVRIISLPTITELRQRDAKAARWYLEMEDRLRSTRNQYYEAIVNNIPEGAKVRYTVKILPLDQISQILGPYTVLTVLPAFTYQDIVAISDGGDASFALYYRQDDNYHYVRVDLLDIATTRLSFELEVNNQRYALSDMPFRPDLFPSLPAINPFADYIVVAIPKSDIPDIEAVRWRGITYDVGKKVNIGHARVMFIHFCMQGLNDLFELPDKSYNPPRTYTQVTMRDELGRYSSRPNSPEGQGVGDGYLYTLESQRQYGIRYLWTFNGGILGLIAHDCPDDLTQIKADIANGVMDPTIAGFGGHRLPYYQKESNLYSIQYGIDIVQNICGHCNDVYYLDQRLYKQIPNVFEALTEAKKVRYLVVDASTGFTPHKETVQPNMNGQGSYLDDHCVWQDRTTGLYLLYITDELREKMVGSSDWEWHAASLPVT
jgi:hypothetical protein